jgi:hypothetical protein
VDTGAHPELKPQQEGRQCSLFVLALTSLPPQSCLRAWAQGGLLSSSSWPSQMWETEGCKLGPGHAGNCLPQAAMSKLFWRSF